MFKIQLHLKDLPHHRPPAKEKLKEINHFFGVGNIYLGTDFVKYSVNSIKDFNKVIIPHFMQYPLVTKKPDFELFKLVPSGACRREDASS